MLARLAVLATTPSLQELVAYITTNTWVESRTWPPQAWSIFGQSVRTNNNVEGWHKSLNHRASGRWQLPFYLLVNLLYREAKLAEINMRLVSERNLGGSSGENTATFRRRSSPSGENSATDRKPLPICCRPVHF